MALSVLRSVNSAAQFSARDAPDSSDILKRARYKVEIKVEVKAQVFRWKVRTCSQRFMGQMVQFHGRRQLGAAVGARWPSS